MFTEHDIAPTGEVAGLSSAEAGRRLDSFGPNALPDRPKPAWRRLARRFWGPLPWMLEGTAAVTFLLGRETEAAIIAALLVVNSLIGYQQSAKAARALAALATRLPSRARVLRDGAWTTLPAASVVPGDVVRIRTGDIVPADLRVLQGEVSVDSSALTGESLPASVGPGGAVPGSGIVTRGEATTAVEAAGAATSFGRAARLVETSEPKTSLEAVVFTIVRSLVALDVVLVAAMCLYAAATGASLKGVVPFALTLLIASVPVALPATFSVAQAIGALDLSRESHVLVTRLPAVQEAASMDVLCTDKTGTLTQNRLELESAHPYPPYGESELLGLAALASDGASQDPIDLALLRAGSPPSGWCRVAFEPFDPSTKQTTATLEAQGAKFRLWAPAARRVELLKDMRALPMDDAGDGWHERVEPGAGPGTLYRFRIDERLVVPDPASRCNPRDVHGPSELRTPPKSLAGVLFLPTPGGSQGWVCSGPPPPCGGGLGWGAGRIDLMPCQADKSVDPPP